MITKYRFNQIVRLCYSNSLSQTHPIHLWLGEATDPVSDRADVWFSHIVGIIYVPSVDFICTAAPSLSCMGFKTTQWWCRSNHFGSQHIPGVCFPVTIILLSHISFVDFSFLSLKRRPPSEWFIWVDLLPVSLRLCILENRLENLHPFEIRNF